MARHIHAEVIIAWANGAKIQLWCSLSGWTDCDNPSFCASFKYRVKPPEDIVLYGFINKIDIGPVTMDATFGKIFNIGGGSFSEKPAISDNVKFTFDGTTRLLKHIEMIDNEKK